MSQRRSGRTECKKLSVLERPYLLPVAHNLVVEVREGGLSPVKSGLGARSDLESSTVPYSRAALTDEQWPTDDV